MLVYYFLKLKYLNKKNYSTLKKYNFFLVNIDNVY
jgi:hypothetical protein